MKALRIGKGRLALALAATAAVPASGAAIAAPAVAAGARAFGARVLDGTDTAHLRLVRQNESRLYEEGSAAGALPGHMRARLTIGSSFAGTCTIYTRYGSITGRGAASPHGVGRFQSFRGTFTVTGGSGRYSRVRGRTRLYGAFDRRTFAVVVQTVGRLSY